MTSRSKFVIQFGATVWQQSVENAVFDVLVTAFSR